MNIDDKRRQEKLVVEKMIQIYYKNRNHLEAQELLEYAFQRIDLCPFMETKTFCSGCKIHCYRDDMKQKIKQVMRYSGPRMLVYHPVLTVKHFIEERKTKHD